MSGTHAVERLKGKHMNIRSKCMQEKLEMNVIVYALSLTVATAAPPSNLSTFQPSNLSTFSL